MFDKNEFAQIIKKIKETYNSQEEFSKEAEIGRTYLSQYMNMKLDVPPKPRILKKLANASHNITTYRKLLQVCGYSENMLKNKVSSIYGTLKTYHKYINHGQITKDNLYEIEDFIKNFQEYLYMLQNNLTSVSENHIFFNDIFNFSTALKDCKYIAGFLLLYNEFLILLYYEKYIDIINYDFIDCFNIKDIYSNLNNLEHLELFSLYSENVIITNRKEELDDIVKYVNSFSRYLSLSYLLEFDSNSLIDLFNKKSLNLNTDIIANESTSQMHCTDDIIFYMCPVYEKSVECIEGRIPIVPSLFDIAKPEEYFFFKVNGECMNKVVHDGAYALIHKQDVVDNGEIALVLINGDKATLKKFTKHGNVVVLEPMSDDNSFQMQIYNKEIPIKILGKYIGKFEVNH